MMNHAGHVNNLRSDERIAAKKREEENNPEIEGHGKRFSEMTEDERWNYYEQGL